jgi:hypothetical protein
MRKIYLIFYQCGKENNKLTKVHMVTLPSLPWDRRRLALPWDLGRGCRACRAGPRSRAVPPPLSGREGRAGPVSQAAPCPPAALGMHMCTNLREKSAMKASESIE